MEQLERLLTNLAEDRQGRATVLGSDDVKAILQEAATKLRALGMRCMIAPLVLPQGISVSLVVGNSRADILSAYVASEHGAIAAHTTPAAFDAGVDRHLADRELGMD